MNRNFATDRRDNQVDAARTYAAIHAAYGDVPLLVAIYAAIARRTATDRLADQVRDELGIEVNP